MDKKWISIASIALTVIGGAASLASNFIDSKKQERDIDKAVEKRIEELKKELEA